MHNNNDEKNPIKQQSFSKIIKIKKSKESNENPEGNKSTTAFTEKDILAFFFYIQMCVCVSVHRSLLLRSCEATSRPARGRSTTATAAGAAERPGPWAVWRQLSLSGWSWTCWDRLSEGPEGETEEFV